MKKQIDHILLGLLWLLATTLGASFLFNTKFGFNIFSGAHWKYFGQIQATGEHINSLFYVFLVLTVIIMIFGLYLLVKPRFKKINMDLHFANKTDYSVALHDGGSAQMINEILPETKPEIIIPETDLVRPPKLNIPKPNNYITVNTPEIKPVQPAPVIETNHSSELEDIFKTAGYIVKKPPKIKNTKPVLWAIGADEVIWIGGENIDPNSFLDAINRVRAIFTETLEDIVITINPFIIDGNLSSNDVKIYKDINELKSELPKNREIPSEETEDFQAYSEYIDTVADYLTKL